MSLLAGRARSGGWYGLLLACVLGLLRAGAATYFVAPNGSDANPGTDLAAPFQTLQHAAALMQAGDTCFLRGGVYRETLAPVNSGTAEAPITFQAYSNEFVTLSGADLVTGWQPVASGLYTAPLGWDLGNGYNQLFIDGAMAHQARYPEFGGGDLLHPATSSVSVAAKNPNLITSAAWGGRPDNYWAGAWFFGGVGDCWAWQCARVLSSSGNTITIEAATRSNPWFSGGGVGFLWGSPACFVGDRQWNLKTQAAGNVLNLRLGAGDNPAGHTIEFKRRFWCVNLAGRDYITIRGLKLRAGAVHLQGRGNVLEDCEARYLSHFLCFSSGYAWDGGFKPGGGVVIEGANNLVRGCTLYDTAGSGITSTGSGNLIIRNLIYQTDYSGTYACSIHLDGRQTRVAFNTAYSSGRDILQSAGAGHAILFNNFSWPGQMCHDLGVVYVWGINGQDPAGVCTRIAYNWLHDNFAPGPAGPLVYLDNWCRNFVVDHNVCWNNRGDAGIRVNGPAAGHRLDNNTLFNCGNVGASTYDMWPNNNPDPAFWTGDFYQYSALNNLFLGNTPQTQLADWTQNDFRLKPGAPALNSGAAVPGCTDEYSLSGAPDQGAYETGGLVWTPGVHGGCEPLATVTVTSADPSNSVPVAVSPADFDGNAGGTTPFRLTYERPLTLTAPVLAGGNVFQKWQQDGVDVGTSCTITTPVEPGHVLTAVYAPLDPARNWRLWWQNTNGPLALWTMNGNDRLGAFPLHPARVDPAWRIVGTGRFTGSGQPDLLWQHSAGWIALWSMEGADCSQVSLLNPGRVDPGWKIAGTADLNGDGQTDILWRNGSLVAAWLMHGTNLVNVSMLSPGQVDPKWRLVGSADLHGDGLSCLLWQHQDGWVAAWQMDGLTCTNALRLNPSRVDPAWKLAGTASLDDNGQIALLWRHDSGLAAYWRMNGFECTQANPLNPGSVDPSWKIVGPK